MLKPYIAKVINNTELSQDEAYQAMEIIMNGKATPAQIGGYLVGLRMKGETVAEITGSAAAMRAAAEQITPALNGPLIDTAGTGGDGSHSINISTAAAFVIAGANYPVAKHGNRAASSKCGSADVLEALGVNLDLAPAEVKHCIEEVGIGFMFAPHFHPAMKYAIGPRHELGQRTLFNLLGPLTNPANASHQLIGVYDPDLTEKMASVLGDLGSKGAMIVHGSNGLDELTTEGINTVSQLANGKVDTYQFAARDMGLRPATIDDLRGGDPNENAESLRGILNGKDNSPRKDVVLLNAAAALAIVDEGIEPGLEKARLSLESGAALEKLEQLISYTQKNVATN
jgi:anthranilate phosphoribosyltransferase